MTRFQHDDTARANAALDAFFTRHGVTPHPTTSRLMIEPEDSGCRVTWGDGEDESVRVSAEEWQQLQAELGDATEVPGGGWKI